MPRTYYWQLLLWSATSLITPNTVLAHGGHGNEFQGGHQTSNQSGTAIEVDK